MNAPRFRAQRGISLIVSLVLLLMVTLVALASIRDVVQEVRMSSATHDRNLGMQAAETALREGEALASDFSAMSNFPATGCAGGYCATPDPNAYPPRWLDAGFAGWHNATSAVSTNSPTPQLILEHMEDQAPNWEDCEKSMPPSPNCAGDRIRVTARSTADGRASVLLQVDVVRLK